VSDTARIVNLYGPTETTLAKAYYVVPDGERLPVTMPVGRAMTATQLLVMNGDKRLCGLGEPGEVVIRTRYPSLGYLQTGRSAPQFLPNPDAKGGDDLLYFTGDLGYIRHDGFVCLTGRRDDQVKIRGMRVELGEVHAALVTHPEIREAAIVAFDSEQGDKRVAAYYVAKQSRPNPAALHVFVKERLPEHMIPFVWIAIDKLPTTPNGKLDRSRLPDPRGVEPLHGNHEYAPPSTELEAQVAEVWRRVLGRSDVGIHDNFFELGGHSLLLLQVKSQLQEVLQRNLPVVALFHHPTIASLAKFLGGEGESRARFLAAAADRVNVRKQALGRRRIR
jgi:hypothetical protein